MPQKIIITESQLRYLIEQSSDWTKISEDDVPKYCTRYRETPIPDEVVNDSMNQWRDIVSKHMVDRFVSNMKKQVGGDDNLKFLQKTLDKTLERIRVRLVNYVTSLLPIYAKSLTGHGGRLKLQVIYNKCASIVLDEMMKEWAKSPVLRGTADFMITKDNVEETKKNVSTFIDKFPEVFVLNVSPLYFNKVERNFGLDTASQVCPGYVVTQDTGGNKLDKSRWYQPNLKYQFKVSDPFVDGDKSIAVQVIKSTLLDELDKLA